MSITIGIDIGGTFTDVVSLDNESGELQYTKVHSTPPRLVDGFMKGADSVRSLASASFTDVSRIAHGTTIGTNAILEARGSTIGILTTKGFEDVLTIGRQKRSDMYDVFIEPETPVFLAPRRRIMGIQERIYANGGVDVPLNEAEVAAAVETLVTEHNVEAIAVCYLFSFANAAHEERTRDIILGAYPGLRVSLSSELDPRFREYERLCLTAFDAYLRPVLERYIQQVRDSLSESGVKARLHIIHSRGGITSDETILSNTVSTVLSGPAAGVIGGVYAGKLSNLTDLITLDMGGTSCDISLVDKGKPVLSNEGKIAKYPLRQPMLDINTIGAGGGSIAWVGGSGALRVGPRSAGASPGPAAYDMGGTEPTVTDASLLLGYLDPGYFAGGSMKLSVEKAEEAVRTNIAGPLGIDILDAAHGIHTIVNNHMADEVRLVSVFRGYDPRNFSLVALGGAGPVHAGRLAEQTNIGKVLVPLNPGVLSAFGLLVANLEHERARTFRVKAVDAVPAELQMAFDGLEAACRSQMDRDAVPGRPVITAKSVEVRYVGQSYELEVPIGGKDVDDKAIAQVIEDFHALHERVYGHRDSDDLVELVTLRVVLSQAPGRAPGGPELVTSQGEPSPRTTRKAYFPEAGGLIDTPIYDRDDLGAGAVLRGPAIVQQLDTTTVVYPDSSASIDAHGNLIIEIS